MKEPLPPILGEEVKLLAAKYLNTHNTEDVLDGILLGFCIVAASMVKDGNEQIAKEVLTDNMRGMFDAAVRQKQKQKREREGT